MVTSIDHTLWFCDAHKTELLGQESTGKEMKGKRIGKGGGILQYGNKV